MSKKRLRVFFTPIELEVEISDKLDEVEKEQRLNEIVYLEKAVEITNETVIDYFEEVKSNG